MISGLRTARVYQAALRGGTRARREGAAGGANGTYYYSAAGTHRGWRRGPSNADFDLYLQRWNGFYWATVARSESVTSEEQIAYNGTAGYYRWLVYSYSGSGSYTFWLQRP